jgi:hypothetical protein
MRYDIVKDYFKIIAAKWKESFIIALMLACLKEKTVKYNKTES